MTGVRTEILRLSLDSTLEESRTRQARVERVIEIYDTSIPADSATGLPPLLSRTTETIVSDESSSARLSSNSSEETARHGESCVSDVTDTASRTALLDESVSRESSGQTSSPAAPGSSRLRKALAIAGVAAIMAALLAILLRCSGNPLMGFLKTIKRFFKKKIEK